MLQLTPQETRRRPWKPDAVRGEGLDKSVAISVPGPANLISYQAIRHTCPCLLMGSRGNLTMVVPRRPLGRGLLGSIRMASLMLPWVA